MTWTETCNFVIEYAGKFITLLGGLSGLTILAICVAKVFGKNFIDEWFAKRNKKYQQELELEIEKYKFELESKSNHIQHNLDTKLELLRIEYGTLYSKRLGVIEELHKWLAYFKRMIDIFEHAIYVKFGNPDYKVHTYTQEDFAELSNLQKKLKEFEDYFERYKIFISKELADAIYAYYTMKLFGTILTMPPEYIQEVQKQQGLTEKEKSPLNKGFEQFNTLFESVSSDGKSIDDLLSMVQEEFRSLIGADIKR